MQIDMHDDGLGFRQLCHLSDNVVSCILHILSAVWSGASSTIGARADCHRAGPFSVATFASRECESWASAPSGCNVESVEEANYKLQSVCHVINLIRKISGVCQDSLIIRKK